MKIAGLQKVSLIDYPDAVAAGVFLGGCNLDCGFCHNRWMIDARDIEPVISVDELLTWLETRVGLLDGVVISGGEPTLHAELGDFIQRIRALGFRIKLDSNGTRPAVLRRLLGAGLVDYVAMDVKASLDGYPKLTGFERTQRIAESVRLLRDGGVAYELRTTIIGSFHSDAEMRGVRELVQGAARYVLQPFIPKPDVPDPVLAASPRTSNERLEELRVLLNDCADEVLVRGE